MIQEPLGGSGFLTGDRNVDNNGGFLQYPTFRSPSPYSTPALSYSPTLSATSSTSSENNLKCPRCDSSNTKFCYYNNYNLTQPRHFCKTCRRYWTKGGALRNVPIGGGCRKNKSVTISTVVVKASASKMKTLSPEIGRCFIGNGLDREILSTPVKWGLTQNSHSLALFRAAQNPKPTSNSIVNSLKEEGATVGISFLPEPLTGTGALRSIAMGSDARGQASSLSLGNDSWRNNKLLGRQQIHGSAMGEVQNNGIQELYPSLRSSSNNYSDRPPVFFRNSSTSTFSASTVLDSNPVVGAGLGWNPAFSWPSDPQTTNGSYP